jgi:hypothetical protein
MENEIISIADEVVLKTIDKQFGDKDPALKMLTKASFFYDEDQTKDLINKLKKVSEAEHQYAQQFLSTLDASGNIVVLDGNDSWKDAPKIIIDGVEEK